MKNFIAGQYISQGSYKSFEPNPINRVWEFNDMDIIHLLSQANRQIGRLDMYAEYIPNIDLFISMHVVKEATLSSKIEGTKTNIEEALLERKDITAEKRNDWEEVQNYIKALNSAIKQLDKLPFSSRLIKQTHQTLLQGVRGKNKLPGEFRRSQNWIGGASLRDAIFIPPPHTSINELMSDLEKFVHSEAYLLPDLLKIALVHYQFETIHPFLDGNGRVGRLMIILFLVDKGILKKPVLYLSDFFEKNRMTYYDNLMRVRQHNDIVQWFKFFLVGVIETAQKSIRVFDRILKLEKRINHKIQSLSYQSENIQKVINVLYQHPIIDAQKVKELIGVSLPTAYKIIKEIEKNQIISEVTGDKRGKLYIFKEYIDLFKG